MQVAKHDDTSVVIRFDDGDDVDALMVDLNSADEHLNWAPAITALRDALRPIADDWG